MRSRTATVLALGVARPVALLALVGVVLALGCERERREFRGSPATSGRSAGITLTSLGPGAEQRTHVQPYDENAYAVSQGKHLFDEYNCSGCHSHGGGGMGPPLMDDQWIYGSEPANIAATIVEGRPNGMPAFRGKIPDDQVWQLVAFVRSLSGLVRTDVASGRDDHMRVKLSEQERNDESPTAAGGLPKTSEMPP